MRHGILFAFLGLLVSCAGENPLDHKYESVGSETNAEFSPLELMEGRDALAVVYLSPECPLCRNYTVPIKKLQARFEGRGGGFLGVVSGDFYSPSEVKSFLLKYKMDMPVIMDPEFLLARQYGAEITPEVHLLDREGNAVYRGAIDNWAISLGQKRPNVTRHYLADAVEAHLSGGSIDPVKTDAVGCYIE